MQLKYLDIINNCKLRIENDFKAFASLLQNDPNFINVNFTLSSFSLENKYQLVEITLTLYGAEVRNKDEGSIEISIGLFQIQKKENGFTTYTSNIKYDKNEDLIFDNSIYVTSDICTNTGVFILKNIDYEIQTEDINSFEKELTKSIENIFNSFKSNQGLIRLKLLEIKNS